MVGPFDNTMNSGFDKDFWTIKPARGQTIIQIKVWSRCANGLLPNTNQKMAILHLNFNSNNSIVLQQTFVQSWNRKDLLLKFGYSGSFKLWLNDSLIYEESEHRETEMDYYTYRWGSIKDIIAHPSAIGRLWRRVC